MLLPPYYSSCTCNPPSTYPSQYLCSLYYRVVIFLCVFAVSTVVLDWQWCHHFLSTCVFEHPPAWLAYRRPIWLDMAPVDTTTQWREDWSSTSVVNHCIVSDPTSWQPGFDLPCNTWSLVNHLRTGQRPCRANLQSPFCDCGQRQTMNHIVDTCPLTKFEGGLKLLRSRWWRSHMAGINSDHGTCEMNEKQRSNQFHFLLFSGTSTGSWSVYSMCLYWLFCRAIVL